MKVRRLIIATAAALAALTSGTIALAADPVYVMPDNFTIPDGAAAMDAALKWAKARTATDQYLALSKTATPLQIKTALDTAVKEFKAYEAAVPAAKVNIADAYGQLTKAGLTEKFDKAVISDPRAFFTNSGELAAIKAIGSPSKAISSANKLFDNDLAVFRANLGLKTAWQFNFSPIQTAHAGTACSVAAWAAKSVTCWWHKACYNYWAKANNDNCM